MARYERTSDEKRILAIVSSMPFGAMVQHHWGDSAITLSEIADYLGKLRSVLRGVAERHQQEQAELSRMRSVIDGGSKLFRELLSGINPMQDTSEA